MGLLINGVYYPDKDKAHIDRNISVEQIHTAGAIVREYENHAHDFIRPYNPDGTPNDDFIAYYPEDAKRYGFIQENKESNYGQTE